MIEVRYGHSTSKHGFIRTSNNYNSLDFIKLYSEVRPIDPFKSMDKDHVITINEIIFW